VIGKLQRDEVWRELDKTFAPGDRVLELNCGTGIDAVHLAQRGVRLIACDVSPRMIEVAQKRIIDRGLDRLVELRILPTEAVNSLLAEGPFDGAFSNFSGLNCVQDIAQVAQHLALLLKPGAKVFLCMVGKFSPWELVWHLAHGRVHLAFRRFRRRPSTHSSVRGSFSIHYPSIDDMVRMFAPEFSLRSWQGIGIAIPPWCFEAAARRMPNATAGLAKLDRYLCRLPLIRSMGDCVLLQFERLS
jgi:SAM-dependent methyltransferase